MGEVIIYTKTGCPFCRATMEKLRADGVDFTERNTSLDREALSKLREFGSTKVPVVVRDGKVVQIGDDRGRG